MAHPRGGTAASGREPGGCPPGFGFETRRLCQTVTGRSPSTAQILDVSVRA